MGEDAAALPKVAWSSYVDAIPRLGRRSEAKRRPKFYDERGLREQGQAGPAFHKIPIVNLGNRGHPLLPA
jgi:hypothetical protein